MFCRWTCQIETKNKKKKTTKIPNSILVIYVLITLSRHSGEILLLFVLSESAISFYISFFCHSLCSLWLILIEYFLVFCVVFFLLAKIVNWWWMESGVCVVFIRHECAIAQYWFDSFDLSQILMFTVFCFAHLPQFMIPAMIGQERSTHTQPNPTIVSIPRTESER